MKRSMRGSLAALCLLALTAGVAHAEVIKLKVDVAYDRCQTVEGRKSCTTTWPDPREVVEIVYNGGTMGKWSTQVTEDGVVLETSIDVTMVDSRYYFQATTVHYPVAHPEQFDLQVLGNVLVKSPDDLNEIAFAGAAIATENGSIAPKVGVAPAKTHRE